MERRFPPPFPFRDVFLASRLIGVIYIFFFKNKKLINK